MNVAGSTPSDVDPGHVAVADHVNVNVNVNVNDHVNVDDLLVLALRRATSRA